MVKNNGGNKAKKFASKSFNVPQKATRFAIDSGEVYAIINKILGGNMCEVLCIDGIIRNCIIRGKFSGKRKRDNILTRGKWVLVGLRDWEITAKEKQKCDLLEVYTDVDKEKLIKNAKDSFRIFLSINNEEEEFDKDQIEFINTKDDEDENVEDENVEKRENESESESESEESEELESEESESEESEESESEEINKNNKNKNKKDISSVMKNMDWININDI